MRDAPTSPVPISALAIEGIVDVMMAAAPSAFDFPDFDENLRATCFYTTGTTGDPKGVAYSHRQLVLHTMGILSTFGPMAAGNRFHTHDVYAITPMFHVHGWGFPYAATMLGLRQIYPGRYQPDNLVRLIDRHGVTFSHCVPTILHMLLTCDAAAEVVACQMEGGDWWFGIAARSGRGGAGTGDQCVFRLWPVRDMSVADNGAS